MSLDRLPMPVRKSRPWFCFQLSGAFALRSGVFLLRFRVVMLLYAAAGLTGCVTQEVTQVTLSGIVIGGTPATGQVAPDALRLGRGAIEQTAAPDTVLQPGDSIWTGPYTEAVVSYPSGARAYLRPNTRVTIGSLFVEIGKVFAKVRGVFQVKTALVTAASEGTEYWVEVQPSGVRTVVAEGRVNFYSNAGAWSRPLGPTEQATSRGGVLQMAGPADPAEIRQELEWVKRMDAQVPLKTVAGTPALIGIGAAAAAGLWWINRDKKEDRPPRSPPGSRRYDPPGPERRSGSTDTVPSPRSWPR